MGGPALPPGFCYCTSQEGSKVSVYFFPDSKTWLARRWHWLERSALVHQRLPNVETTLEKTRNTAKFLWRSIGLTLGGRWTGDQNFSGVKNEGHYANKQINVQICHFRVQNLIFVSCTAFGIFLSCIFSFLRSAALSNVSEMYIIFTIVSIIVIAVR